MDSDWFRNLLEGTGLTQADLARHLGLAPSAVSRMILGERQMKLQEAVTVSELLGVSSEEVLRKASSEAVSPATEPRRRGRPSRGLPSGEQQSLVLRRQSQDLIPIRSGSGHGMPADDVIGQTPRPGNLAGVRDAYAIYVTEDDLSPRYEPGWLLHVHPFKP